MNRSKSYDHRLSEKMRNPKFAQNFFITLMEGEEGLSVEEALKHAIQRMGVKEFSEVSGIPSPNIVDFLKDRRRPKPETLDLYLYPFRLKIKIELEKVA
ncbi:MAG: hypothetical protein A2Z91_02450 [Deltaproteobacteria bacterium GWA2_38_16]|nr:MAG: hypothetical protein A2Z91_02450 [Deltaproteobacteria bacterium GWA2_38_16]OGQ02055.1 MAG: hypothetical protein A3D19_08745 [Deltaproteobacteria bacterium RIFCSPHIGHO2_02_FULL_38_15]OGQ33537.1 MAG: hypothetical protein A3A72_08690 [Deltaproteobacteria bacterium RIFCSPLOWO2_01_FULL_38_9]OGQ64222.1 MAG: hypothetical protein A3G92_06425 [Deltaproteobacteria bacterium RIFCSPLOWO2_12_FULL_38_8]HBQ21591.1 hypothetical protein [Deltaproteobacteria bacterium]